MEVLYVENNDGDQNNRGDVISIKRKNVLDTVTNLKIERYS